MGAKSFFACVNGLGEASSAIVSLFILASIVFGGIFTLATAYALGLLALRNTQVPAEIALAVGSVIESMIVFFLLLNHHAHWSLFLIMGALALLLPKWVCHRPRWEPVNLPTKIRIVATVVFGAYFVWYFVNALAPETMPDGLTYHLGLPSAYVRLHEFPSRVTFYDMFPQGMEMLYTVAFAFGRHSAAKLVEFGLFLATLPLIFRTGRLLRMSDLAVLTAAVFYFCAPVAGLTGSSSYNDAAEVFFALASLYLLIGWRETANARYLLPAGLLAGFCCAIKLSGAFAIAAAILYVLAQRPVCTLRSRMKAAAAVASGSALVIAPWLARDAVVARNPVAPFLNQLFPNPWFPMETERQLSATLGSLGSVKLSLVPWELAFGDHLHGTFGPLLLALPIGLWALRRPAGRLVLAAAVILALPWYFDSGARFLMPAVAFAALALGMALPRPAAWAAIALQAVLCWPSVMDWREGRHRHSWRLDEFPIAAALRITPESDYVAPRAEGFSLARLIERESPPDAKILALTDVAAAYSTRDVRVWWQSAEASRLADSLRAAVFAGEGGLYEWKAEWPLESVDALRVSVPAAAAAEFDIADLWLYSGADQVRNRKNWRVRAWPNQWEASLALDGNLLTRWRSRQPVSAGMYLQVRFDQPRKISTAVLFSHAFRPGAIEFVGWSADAPPHRLGVAKSTPLPMEHLRLEAALAMRGAGYRYLLAPTGGGGYAPIGNAIVGQEAAWGFVPAGYAGRFRLFRIK